MGALLAAAHGAPLRLLLFLVDGYGGHGGIAQVNRDLIEALSLHPQIAEIVALPRRIEAETGPLPAKLRYDRAAAQGGAAYLRRTALRLLGDRRFDLVIAGHLNLQPVAAAAAWATGAPAVLLLHGVEAWTPPRRWLTRACAATPDLCLGVSALTLARFRRWATVPEAKCRVLPCAVDLDRFRPGPPDPAIVAKYRLAGTRPILTLARLAAAERYKGIDELLAALPALLHSAPDIVYVVAGKGDDAPRLQAKAAALGVADKVRFTGYVSEVEKLALYRSARAFVLAGTGEGFGIVLLEAMGCGVPVVASLLDGSYEAVGQGRLGLAVDPTDEAALVNAVLAALARPCGVRPEGLDAFSFAAFAGRVHRLVDELAQGAAAPARGRDGTCGSTT